MLFMVKIKDTGRQVDQRMVPEKFLQESLSWIANNLDFEAFTSFASPGQNQKLNIWSSKNKKVKMKSNPKFTNKLKFCYYSVKLAGFASAKIAIHGTHVPASPSLASWSG